MALSTEDLQARLAKQEWTAHNIRLDSVLTTRPGRPGFAESDMRLHAIVRTLRMLYGEDFTGIRIADMGCLEGGFSLSLAQRGAVVTGVEGRSVNMEKLRLLQDHFALPNLKFIQADVKEFGSIGGEFDVVLALGILYHLDEPARWLRHLAEITGRVLFVDTHFAPADEAAMATLDTRLPLGGLESREADGWTTTGRWFFEYPEGIDPEPQVWASWSNNRSFWLTKESLLLSLRQAGFSLVLEQHDYSMGSFDLFNRVYPRCMLVAIKDR